MCSVIQAPYACSDLPLVVVKGEMGGGVTGFTGMSMQHTRDGDGDDMEADILQHAHV